MPVLRTRSNVGDGQSQDDLTENIREEKTRVKSSRKLQSERAYKNIASSPAINEHSYLSLLHAKPKPFYTPQFTRPLSDRENTSNRLLNTIATPSRHATKQRQPAAREQKVASLPVRETKSSPSVARGGVGNGHDTTPGLKQNGGLDESLTKSRSQRNVEAFINSLSNDSEEEGMDLECEEDGTKIEIDVLEGLGGSVSPLQPDVSSTASMGLKVGSTPAQNVYTKVMPRSGDKNLGGQSREEKRAEAAAVIELFDDSSDEALEEDPLTIAAPEAIKQTRKVRTEAEKGVRRGRRNKSAVSEAEKKPRSGRETAATPPPPLTTKKSRVPTSTTRSTRSQSRGRQPAVREIKETMKTDESKTRRSTRAAKADLQKSNGRSYRHDDLGDMSSESEWSSGDESTSRSSAQNKKNLAKNEKKDTTVSNKRRSARVAKVVSLNDVDDRPYENNVLENLSSESEWSTSDGESATSEDDEESNDLEIICERRDSLKALAIRKRASPNATTSTTKAKRPRLSLSAKRRGVTDEARKVRTVERKGVATGTRRNGVLATPTIATPSRRKVVTPCIPQRKKVGVAKNSSRSGKSSQFEEAKQRLHVSALPETIPCRENEFVEICNYIEGKLQDGTGGCMYISGVPGTGKTATVREVSQYLRQSCDDGDLPKFKFVEINGMRLTDPHRAYVSILKQLTGEDATPDHASLLLDKHFSSSKNKVTTVLLADELDLLWTRKQTVLYNLFDWPTRQHAKLVVLAVANTMDLPEKVMMNKVSSRLGLTRLTFQPYTFQQLQEIVTSRMAGLKVFEPDAIQLAARKVAAVSGDARRALDIARRATELAQLEKGAGLVGIPHIDKAVQEMFSSVKVQAIRHASLHERMFLKGVLSEFRRSGLEETTFKGVQQQLEVLYRTEGMQPANLTELHVICSELGACRLLLVEKGRLNIHTRIRLNISQDDVVFALRTSE